MTEGNLFEERHEEIWLSIVKATKELYIRHLRGNDPVYLLLDPQRPDFICVGGHVDQIKAALESANVMQLQHRELTDEFERNRRQNLEQTLRRCVLNLFDLLGTDAAFLSLLEAENAHFVVAGGSFQEVRDLVARYDPD